MKISKLNILLISILTVLFTSLITIQLFSEKNPIKRRWLLTGDSLTEQMFQFWEPNIANEGRSQLKSSDIFKLINTWLAHYPDVQVVTLSYGTNDGCTGMDNYKENMLTSVKHLKELGRVVYIPTVPWAYRTELCITDLNKELEKIYIEYPEVRGPDLYSLFKNNPELISKEDNLHPTKEGYKRLKDEWLKFIKEKDN